MCLSVCTSPPRNSDSLRHFRYCLGYQGFPKNFAILWIFGNVKHFWALILTSLHIDFFNINLTYLPRLDKVLVEAPEAPVVSVLAVEHVGIGESMIVEVVLSATSPEDFPCEWFMWYFSPLFWTNFLSQSSHLNLLTLRTSSLNWTVSLSNAFLLSHCIHSCCRRLRDQMNFFWQ